MGRVTVGDSLVGYYCRPEFKSARSMGVVVVHDMFGYELPNCRYIADHMAYLGYDALLPDFFGRLDVEPWPATEAQVPAPFEGEAYNAYIKKITTDISWDVFDQDVESSVALLRRKGCTKFAILGLSWGGLAAERAARSGQFLLSVSAHGWLHTPDAYLRAKGKMLYLCVPGDPLFDETAQSSLEAAGGEVKVFEGVATGFLVRGDFEGDPRLKATADEAMEEIESALHTACLRKSKCAKVGALHPAARNFTCVVQVLGEAQAQARKEADGTTLYEVTCGDETGMAVLALSEDQQEGLCDGKVLCIRDGHVEMVGGCMRLVVGSEGHLEKDVAEDVPSVGSVNLSAIDFELQQQ